MKVNEKKVLRYLFLVDRRLEIILNSGVNWKQEYEDELKSIDMELDNLRRLVDAEHIKRGGFEMYKSAKEGNIFVLTQKGYEATPDKVKKEREVGQPLRGYAQDVPVSWIKEGYVEERAELKQESVYSSLEKFQREVKEKGKSDNQKQRDDRQEER